MRTERLLGAVVWLVAAALVVLAARALAYALAAPTLLRPTLAHSAGGPRLVLIAVVALAVCAGLATAVVWLAAVAVHERAALSELPVDEPRLRPGRILAHALALGLATCVAFTALESYLHLRSGLAWHGLGCLTGPVHVNAVPILLGFSALAAAAIEAARHVLAWMRRTLRLLHAAASPGHVAALVLPPTATSIFADSAAVVERSRAPPVVA
jgi:hypothetical protein